MSLTVATTRATRGEGALATIAVAPASVVDSHARLLRALSRAFDVDFEPTDGTSLHRYAGLIVFGQRLPELKPLPTLFVDAYGEGGAGASHAVCFENTPMVPVGLRGQVLHEAALCPLPVRSDEPAEILASASGTPIWMRDAGRPTWTTTTPVAELAVGETLRSRLAAGRFAGLLPVVEFLREVTEDSEWEGPAPRACFVFDDPNLHAMRYGHLRFNELRDDAARARYHVAMATVPLDMWYSSPRAARLFRESPDTLSLTVHGIAHTARELDRNYPRAVYRQRFAHALRLIQRFERKHGLQVARVMIAPHGTCSAMALEELLAIGFDGASLEWPYWWFHGNEDALAGWEPADVSLASLPVLPRHHLGSPRDDLVLRRYLRQPLILYGHHADVATGLDSLRAPAELINQLGYTEWCDLRTIGETNYRIRYTGEGQAVIRTYSARARIALPANVTRIRLRGPAVHVPGASPRWLVEDGERVFAVCEGEEVGVPAGGTLQIRLTAHGSADTSRLSPWRFGPWSVGRRALAEGRDRLIPRVPFLVRKR